MALDLGCSRIVVIAELWVFRQGQLTRHFFLQIEYFYVMLL